MTLRHDVEDIVEGNGTGTDSLVERIMAYAMSMDDQERQAVYDEGYTVGQENGYEAGVAETEAKFRQAAKETKS